MDHLSTLLIIEDDADVAEAARIALFAHVDQIDCVTSPADGIERIEETRYDCVLLDMNFTTGDRSGNSGLASLEEIIAIDPAVSVLLMTAYGGVSLAVEGIKRGAVDFVLKPWRNAALLECILDASEQTRQKRSVEPLEITERNAIKSALSLYGGNVARTARALGLSRPSLYRRMEKYGFE